MKTRIKFFAAVAVMISLSGCAPAVVNTLVPLSGTEQTKTKSAVEVECVNEASKEMPKTLGFLEVIPLTTYAAIYNAYAACAQQYGYEAQCLDSKWVCGSRLVGDIY